MNKLLLLAALGLATPAMADPPVFGSPAFSNGSTFDGRFDRRLRRGTDSVFVYDRDYQGDSTFRRDGFNDWWHSDTARAFPRWMANNRGCKRMWWSGGGWTC